MEQAVSTIHNDKINFAYRLFVHQKLDVFVQDGVVGGGVEQSRDDVFRQVSQA